ncbi:hypothetical protein C8J57DRAFT_1230450 [Mycena rebaudengoi]|nr:hypothetical protein C8J57DRAFT_1230450 [Mycena rebaudengoi]
MAQSGRDGNDGLMFSLPVPLRWRGSFIHFPLHGCKSHRPYPTARADPSPTHQFDSNDFSNVPPSRETSFPSQSLVSTNSYPPNHDYTWAHVPPSSETSLPSQSLVSPNSYPPNHDHISTHVPPSPETSLPCQSLVSVNSYAPTHDHPSHLNHSAPTPNGQLQTGTVTPRQNAMYLDIPPAFTHDPGESNEAAVIIAPRRYLLWLREMLQRQPQFQFFLSTLSQLSDCSAALDTHYADTNLPSSAPSAHCEAEHAVRSVTTEYDTGPTQSTNVTFGSGASLHYAAGLADAAETAPPTILLQSFPSSSASHPTTYPELGGHSEPVYNFPNADMRLLPSACCGPGRSQLGGRSAAPDASYAGMNLPPSAPSAFCEPGHAVQSVATVFDSCPWPSTHPGAFRFPPTPPVELGHHPAVSAGAAPMASGGPRPSARRHQSTNPLKSGRHCFWCHTPVTTQWRRCGSSWFCNPSILLLTLDGRWGVFGASTILGFTTNSVLELENTRPTSSPMKIAAASMAAAHDRCDGSTAPVERLPCPFRQPFSLDLNGTVAVWMWFWPGRPYYNFFCSIAAIAGNCDGNVQPKFNYLSAASFLPH